MIAPTPPIPFPAPRPPRVALVHDWLTGMRGGEKVIEAMASGVAVITSNTSALKEIAQEGDQPYALLVDPLDLDGMAKAIAHLMGSPEARARYVELGVERAEQFRWDQTARQTLDIYLSAIEGGA